MSVARLLTDDLDEAAAALRAGGLVAFPTETVYGLGADAAQPRAVARVYAAKGRPADHPLIVHAPDVEAALSWAQGVPAWAAQLAAACWPGPLTLVLPRAAAAGLHLTGGQDTVGVRVPDHPLALALLRAVGGGVAAPSANRFGQVSPTTAAHVLAGLGEALRPGTDLVLDGGPCAVGVESTILDATGSAPRLLRPGGVTVEQVQEVTGLTVLRSDGTVRAPGTLAAHYAPQARVVLADVGSDVLTPGHPDDAPTRGLLALADVATPAGWVRLAAPADVGDYARVLYASLREADALGLATVVAVPPQDAGLGGAVRDRLARAAASG